MGNRESRVVAYAEEAGHARVMLPALEAFAGRRYGPRLLMFGHQQAVPILERSDLPWRRGVSHRWRGHPKGEIFRVLREDAPGLLVTGISNPRSPSRMAVGPRVLWLAQDKRWMTLGILDHWQGLDRFSGNGRAPRLNAPRHLGVMDEWTKHHLAPRLPETQITVIGHPSLERIRRRASFPGSAARRVRRRRQYGIGFRHEIWVVVGQPLVRKDDRSERTGLFSTKVGSEDFAEWVKRLSKRREEASGRRVRIVFRPHPKEPSPAALGGGFLRGVTVEDLLETADLFIGWDSMLLLEGHASGVPVLIMQHRKSEFEWVDLERIGISTCFADPRAAEEWVTTHPGWRRPARHVTGPMPDVMTGATERTIRWLQAVLRQSTSA